MTINDMILRIDVVADAVRARLVGDPVRAFEYQAAEQGARAYAEAGYSGPVPGVVQGWADARGWTLREAADNILGEAAQFRGALEGIRALRLQGKYALQDATVEQAQVIFQQTIAALKSVGA